VYKHDQKHRLPSLLFCVLQTGTSIKLEVYDITIINRVVPTLLPVLSCSLKSHADTSTLELLIT
jgi:hypothetical protein